MRRLIFINRFFFPDYSATSQLLADLAFHFAGTGREVHVVTSTQTYNNPRASLPVHEIIRGVEVHRVASTQFGRAGLLGRAADYASFYLSASRSLGKVARQGDIVVAKTDPPLISVVAMAITRRNASLLVNWLQDIYPEIAVALGVPFTRGPVARVLVALRNRSLRSAAGNVAVGDLMAQKIQSLGAPRAGIHVIPNWCDDEAIRPVDKLYNPLRAAWALDDKFVIGYSGNLGRAHDAATVLDASERLRGDSRLLFLMVGGGKLFDEMARAVKARHLESLFRFVPYQEKIALAYSLSLPDVHWVSLNPTLEGLIVPSKFYGAAAAGKPMIIIAAKDGELGRLVQEYACGVVIAPGDSSALAATLSHLANNPASLVDMGMRARKMLETRFTRKQAFDHWRALFDSLDRLP